MSNNKGTFIKLWRDLKESSVWAYTDSQFKVFINILLEANYGESWVRVGGERVRLEPGDLVTSRKQMASETGVSEDTVYRTWENLENDGVINRESHNDGTLITVLNWGKWQATKNEPHNEPHNASDNEAHSESDNASDTQKEYKEEQEEKECNKGRNKEREIFDHWVDQSETTSHRKFTSKMKSSINARLNDGYDLPEIKEAIDNYNMVCKSDDYYWTHDSWSLDEFLSRGEGSKMEKFLLKPDSFLKDKEKKKEQEKWEKKAEGTDFDPEELKMMKESEPNFGG